MKNQLASSVRPVIVTLLAMTCLTACPKNTEVASTTPSANVQAASANPAAGEHGVPVKPPLPPRATVGNDLPPATADDVAAVQKGLTGTWTMAVDGPNNMKITQTLIFTGGGEFTELNAAGEQVRKQQGTYTVTKGTPERFAIEIKVPAFPRPVTNVYELLADGALQTTMRDAKFRFERAP